MKRNSFSISDKFIVNMTKFCLSDDKSHENIVLPYCMNGKLYATDGKILVEHDLPESVNAEDGYYEISSDKSNFVFSPVDSGFEFPKVDSILNDYDDGALSETVYFGAGIETVIEKIYISI